MGGYSDDGAVVAADAPAVDEADEEPALVVPERLPTEPVPVVSPGAVPPLPPVPPVARLPIWPAAAKTSV